MFLNRNHNKFMTIIFIYKIPLFKIMLSQINKTIKIVQILIIIEFIKLDYNYGKMKQIIYLKNIVLKIFCLILDKHVLIIILAKFSLNMREFLLLIIKVNSNKVIN